MSKYTTIWSYIVDVAEALVSAGEFDKLYLNTYPKQVPDTFKRVLLLFAEKEGERDSGSTFLWEGTYRCTILRPSWGADADSGSVDELIGQAGFGGIGALAATLRDNLETNLRTAYGTCSLEFGEIEYRYREKDQRHVATFTFIISMPEFRGNRSEGAGGVVSILPSGSELDDLTDVTLTSVTSGQVLKYNGTAWVNGTDDAGTTIASIDDISDVIITAVAGGEVLVWNAGQAAWINQTLAEAGISAVGHAHTLDNLSDVATAGQIAGSLLVSDGAAWTPTTGVLVGSGEFPLVLPILDTAPSVGLVAGAMWILLDGATYKLQMYTGAATKSMSFA